MNKLLARFVKDQSAATAIEYGLAVVIITAVATVGTNVSGTFTKIGSAMN